VNYKKIYKKIKKLLKEKEDNKEDEGSIQARITAIIQSSEKRKESFFKDNPEIKKEIEKLESIESIDKSSETSTINNSENKKEDIDINKSFIFSNVLEKYETLDAFGKIAVALLILKSTLVSAIISIIFIFYGDYLINRFNLETKYPKLAEIIKLRQKFNKYYLIWSLFIIVSVILVEVIFCLFILIN